jgi:hypothetical protein
MLKQGRHTRALQLANMAENRLFQIIDSITVEYWTYDDESTWTHKSRNMLIHQYRNPNLCNGPEYKSERISLPAIALTTDTSAITAIGNDYGYDEVFARQLSGVGNSGDLLIGISTSGNSTNILKALKIAKQKGIKTAGLSGKGGGEMNSLCDINVVVPSNDTARIQEMHILIIHTICAAIDGAF